MINDNELNLDFELKDPATEKPINWAFNEYSNYTLSLDSEYVHSGKFSLKIKKQGHNDSFFNGTAGILINGIQANQDIKLTGFIKTEDTNVDSIGLYISYQASGESVLKSTRDEKLIGSNDWQEYSIEIETKNEPEVFVIGGYLIGKGTIWIDDLKLYVEGRPLVRNPEVEVHKLNNKEIKWLKEHVIPFKTVEAENGFEDLEPIKQVIGNARIVALGENTHGSSEIFKTKHRLVEFLSSKMDFTIFSIEANMPEAYRLNDYVLYGEGDSRKLLSGMYFWTWDTQEVLDMIEWMRKFNTENKGLIQFTGFDMQFYHGALENLLSYAEKNDPQIKIHVDSLSTLLKKTKINYSNRNQNKEAVIPIQHICNQVISYLYQNTKQNETESKWALQNAIIIHQFLKQNGSENFDYTYRDKCMAENIGWILDNNPDSKIILWAHNGHISKHSGAMGKFLSDKYEEDYLAIGFLHNSGKYTAVDTKKGLNNENILIESEPGSFEYNFSKIDTPIFLLDFREVNEDEPNSIWLNNKLKHRSIGAVAVEHQFYPAFLSKDYDAIIYLEATNPSECFRLR
jgi:erythromycin esterase